MTAVAAAAAFAPAIAPPRPRRPPVVAARAMASDATTEPVRSVLGTMTCEPGPALPLFSLSPAPARRRPDATVAPR